MSTQANEPRSQRDDVHGTEDTESCQIVRIPEDYDILTHATDNLDKDIALFSLKREIDKEQDQERQAKQVRKITTSEFEKLLEKQKSEHETKKWSDLAINEIYTVTGTRMVHTQNGRSMILTLLNDGEVWAPERLKNKIADGETYKYPPFYVRPLGLKPCKSNPRNKYHAFDLVYDDTEGTDREYICVHA